MVYFYCEAKHSNHNKGDEKMRTLQITDMNGNAHTITAAEITADASAIHALCPTEG